MGSLHNHSSLSNSLWSIILSGGEGQRMRPHIERWLGHHIPKQYCTFVGTRSMLQHTWDRADLLTHPFQKLTVLAPTHRAFVWPETQLVTAGRFVFQPKNRNTAAGVFLPLTYVRSWNPEATVIVYPSDHFIFPEELFAEQVKDAVHAIKRWPDRLFLLGATPKKWEAEYGWMERGSRLGWENGNALWSVASFREKPSTPPIGASSQSRWLWNTMVVVARLETLWDVGWKCFPHLMERFTTLEEVIGTQRESAMLDVLYEDMPSHNFSSDLLEQTVDHLGVIEMSNVVWSDWGRPERIADTLRDIGITSRLPMENFVLNQLDSNIHKDAMKAGQKIGNI